MFFDSTELEVHALARGAGRRALRRHLARRPDLQGRRARARRTTFFDPDDKYIWALAVDRQGNVFAGTGDKGIVYQITPDGKGASSSRPRPRTPCRWPSTPSNQLLVGTGSPGRVFRVDADGKGFLLLDTTFQEIHALRVDPKGVIYAAAQSGRAPGRRRRLADRRSPPPPVDAVDPERLDRDHLDRRRRRAGAGAVGAASSAATSAAAPTGAVYRMQPDGLWDQLWESRDDAPYDLAFEPDGALLVATGSKGKLFRLSGDPVRAMLLTRVPAQQVTHDRARRRSHVRRDRESRAAVGVSSARATRGTYESDVQDARLVSTWGVGGWRASAPAGTEGRGLHALGQHRDARRHVERLGRPVRQRRRLADHQPEGALPAVARRADRQARRARS